MKYFKLGQELIKGRVKGAIRSSDVKRAAELFDEVCESIVKVNQLKDIEDDSLTAINSTGGIVLSANKLAEIELPLVFKPLILPRSIRFSLNTLPKNPDLKDYTSLGGSKSQVDIEVGKLITIIDEFKAILMRNQHNMNSFKIGEVWKDQVLSDVLDNVTVKGSNNKLESRLCDLTQVNKTQVPCPVIDISNLINLFNFRYSLEQWGEVFKIAYQLPSGN